MNNNINKEIYIRKIMLELGFKPNLGGYTLFKDGVHYLLNNEKQVLWNRNFYPLLGSNYNISGSQVEREIRHLLEKTESKPLNNDVYKYVYRDKQHLTVSECLTSTTEYIKQTTPNEELETKIRYIVYELGIPYNIKGYHYFKDTILYIINKKEQIEWEKLYSDIAQINNTTSFCIERNLRRFVERAYTNKLNSQLAREIYKDQDYLSISKFILEIIKHIETIELPTQKAITNNYICPELNNMNSEEKIKYIIKSLEINPNLEGYYYLEEAIKYVLLSDYRISWVSLYEEIANTYNTTYTKVERNIRYTIERWLKETKEKNRISDITKFIINYSQTFTNSEFIALIAEYIKINTKEYSYENKEQKTLQEKKLSKKLR